MRDSGVDCLKNSSSKIKKKQRENSLDLLRVLSMFMIIVIHSQTFGIFHYGSPTGFNLFVLYLIRALFIVASNCYVIISGYFLILKAYKRKKVAFFIFEVSMYSVFIYLCLVIFGAIPFSISELIHSCFILFYGNYWFASLYLVLYLLSPFLTIFLRQLSKKKFQQLLFVTLLIFSFWATFSGLPILGMNEGYSIGTFVLLYFIGAYIQLYDFPVSWTKGWYLFHYINISIGIALYLFLVGYDDWLLYYHSPLILLSSVFLFLFFKNSQIRVQGLSKIVPFIFGVYLIHENTFVRTLLWEKWIPVQDYLTHPLVNSLFLGLSVIIFVICLIISACVYGVIKKFFYFILISLG